MAVAGSEMIEKKEAAPFFENPSPQLRRFNSRLIWGEIPGDKLIIHWDESIHNNINYLDDDLIIQLLNPDDKSVFTEAKVNFLGEKEFDIPAGNDYLVKMAIVEKFRISVITTSENSPRVTFIPEGDERYMLTWSELEWDQIRREVEREHGINWEDEIEVALRIVRNNAADNALEEEWVFTGMSDSQIVSGKIKEISLIVLHREDNFQLKEIFRLNLVQGRVKEILDEMSIQTPNLKPYLYTYRIVHELDTSNIRVIWDIPDELWTEVEKQLKSKKKNLSDMDTVLKLYRKYNNKTSEIQPEVKKKVFGKGDWFFGYVPNGGIYSAKLVLQDKNGKEYSKPVMESNEFYIPEKSNDIVLLPIDERRIFAYWHLNQGEVLNLMKEKHDAEPEDIRYFIKMYHEYAGGIHHQPHLDAEISLYGENYYMAVDPDKIYRAQIIAVAEGWKLEELTPVSNPVQTGRTGAGSNPPSYISFPQPQDHPTHRPIDSVQGTANYSIGKMIFHLHAHLPFIGKRINYGDSGVWRPAGYTEEWFHEAMRETYIPLINTFDALIDEGVDFKMSMDISPTLTNMMQSTLLQEEFLKYIDTLTALAKTELERTTREEPWYTAAVKMHLNEFRKAKSTFLKYGRDITRAFKKFQDMGKLEISTCGATHGFLPLMGSKYIEAIKGQIKTAVIDYERTFGRKPYGIWLPECAYTTGIEKVLEEFGIRYFFVETHTMLNGDSHVEFGVHAPVYLKGSQVAAFARDPETGKQVWSGEEGYPGDADYLEFHIRGGPLKYNRITDRTGGWKQPYVPEWAEGKTSSHAQHFMENRNFRFDHIKNWFWKKPLIVATYDAELFGHHWYEGPRFLYYMLKKFYYDQNQTELTTPSDYLAVDSYDQEIYLTPSSWGDKGTFDKWMYGSISWMYRHMNDACSEMIKLTSWALEKGLNSEPWDNPGIRMLKQMGRHLLVAQNSDNGFNMSNGHFVDRIKEMFFDDLESFWMLANMFVKWMNEGSYDEVKLRKLERNQHIFPDLDPFAWAKR